MAKGELDMLERLDAWAQSRNVRHDMGIVALYLCAALYLVYLIAVLGPRYFEHWFGIDAAAYYFAWTHDLYGPYTPVQRRYLYSPLFAQVVWPLTHLPVGAFIAVWTAGISCVFLWLMQPVRLVWRVPLLILLCAEEVIIGNVRALLALALVLSFTRPGFWAMPMLTKPATAIGLLYYPLTRQWRSLLVALSWTGVLVGVSFALSPHLWWQWLGYLTSGDVEPPDGQWSFAIRLAIALLLVVVAARRREYWWLAISMMLASPVIHVPAEVALLAAIPRLRQAQPRRLEARTERHQHEGDSEREPGRQPA